MTENKPATLLCNAAGCLMWSVSEGAIAGAQGEDIPRGKSAIRASLSGPDGTVRTLNDCRGLRT